jgi:hypothetical protein
MLQHAHLMEPCFRMCWSKTRCARVHEHDGCAHTWQLAARRLLCPIHSVLGRASCEKLYDCRGAPTSHFHHRGMRNTCVASYVWMNFLSRGLACTATHPHSVWHVLSRVSHYNPMHVVNRNHTQRHMHKDTHTTTHTRTRTHTDTQTHKHKHKHTHTHTDT